MFIAMSANRRLIIHEGRLQMFAIEQHGEKDFRIVQEFHRTQLGEPYATRKAAQEALKQLGEIAIRAIPPQIESPEIAGFLGR